VNADACARWRTRVRHQPPPDVAGHLDRLLRLTPLAVREDERRGRGVIARLDASSQRALAAPKLRESARRVIVRGRYRSHLQAALVSVIVLIVHAASPICTSFDSRWTIHTAASILHDGDTALDEYEPYLRADDDYAIERRNGHPYNRYPIGTTLLALPFVAAIDVLAAIAPLPDTARIIESSSVKYWSSRPPQSGGRGTRTAAASSPTSRRFSATASSRRCAGSSAQLRVACSSDVWPSRFCSSGAYSRTAAPRPPGTSGRGTASR
jgi:hypothetical protein